MQPKRVVKLNEARALTPPVNPVEAMRRQLQLAVFDSVRPDDVIQLATKLKEQAMAGDLRAMKLYFELVLGKDQKAPTEQPQAAESIAEALNNLVDEIRVARLRDRDPAMLAELRGLEDLNGHNRR